jgi:hypothetical protein
MIGCEDGRVAYLVVGKGGVGGIGETLYALPWNQVALQPGKVLAKIDRAELDRMPPIDPADWPAHALSR